MSMKKYITPPPGWQSGVGGWRQAGTNCCSRDDFEKKIRNGAVPVSSYETVRYGWVTVYAYPPPGFKIEEEAKA